MVDGGIGISAAVAIGAKFIERSKFTARHDGVYDKESEKRVRLAERFEKIPKEDVDHFEWEEYNSLHARLALIFESEVTSRLIQGHLQIFAGPSKLQGYPR